jgi:hypothetical protein
MEMKDLYIQASRMGASCVQAPGEGTRRLAGRRRRSIVTRSKFARDLISALGSASDRAGGGNPSHLGRGQ